MEITESIRNLLRLANDVQVVRTGVCQKGDLFFNVAKNTFQYAEDEDIGMTVDNFYLLVRRKPNEPQRIAQYRR